MSIKNRNEIATQVTTKIVPEVDNATHIDLLNNDVVNSMLTRKDVINSASPVGGALTVDYSEGSNTDLATATLTQSTAVTFTGLENGDVKYLLLTKSAGYAVTFVGTTNVSDSQDYIDSTLTSVLYAVYQKNGANYVKSITKSLLEATTQEVLDGVANKYVTPETLQNSETYKEVGNDSGATTLNSNFINSAAAFNLSYKKDTLGNVWVNGVVKATANTGTITQVLFTLPTAYQVSNRLIRTSIITENGVLGFVEYDNSPKGEITFNPKSGSVITDDLITINLYIPKDA